MKQNDTQITCDVRGTKPIDFTFSAVFEVLAEDSGFLGCDTVSLGE